MPNAQLQRRDCARHASWTLDVLLSAMPAMSRLPVINPMNAGCAYLKDRASRNLRPRCCRLVVFNHEIAATARAPARARRTVGRFVPGDSSAAAQFRDRFFSGVEFF